MKKFAKILALVLVMSLVLSISAFASGEPAGAFAQVDDTHWAGDALTVTAIEYGEEFTEGNYVDSTLFSAVSKIVYDGGEIDVDYATQTAILTVDGAQVDLYNAAGQSFKGDVVITLVQKGDASPYMGAPFGADKIALGHSFGDFYYTAAAYIADGAYDAAKSVEAAQMAGSEVGDDAATVGVVSAGDYFSAFYVKDSDYAINDSLILLEGAAGDDFHGWGAGVVALGDSNVEINGSVMIGQGVLRSGIFTGDNAVVTVNDSVIVALNDDDAVPYDLEDNYAVPMMQQCPYGLGIQGNIRATLSSGAGCNIVNNSLVASNGWAVLSTDSGVAGTEALVARDMVAVVGTVEGIADEADATGDFVYEAAGALWDVHVGQFGQESGYIAYADMGVLDYAYNSRWYSPDYLGIITTGTMTMAEGSYGWSGRIGFMSHAGGGTSGHGTLAVSDSEFDVQNIFAVSQANGTYTTTTTIDNTVINLAEDGTGILFIQAPTDDNAGGPGNTSNTLFDLTYDEYLVADAASGEPSEDYSELIITDSDLAGDIFNASNDDGVGLVVTLDNASVTGAVSSAYSYHVKADGSRYDETTIACDYYTGTVDGSSGAYDYTAYLRIAAESAVTVNNPVTLTLTNGSVWTPVGVSYLAELTIDDASAVEGATMTVNGVETPIAAGTYTGEIVITAGAAAAAVDTGAPSDNPPERPADLGPSDEPPGGFGGID